MSTKDFFLEIGTEEIPAGFIKPGLNNLKNIFKNFFNDNNIKYKNIKTFGTPRRLTLLVEEIAEKQDDIFLKKTGPSKKAAFDEKGNPTKAAIGFAKSQGVTVNDLKIITTDKGEYIAVEKIIHGKEVTSIIIENFETLLKKLVFPKNMKWGTEKISFARPIHWITAIFHGKNLTLNYGNIKSENFSFGHRFMAPESFQVASFSEYITELEKRYVIIDIDQRKNKMIEEIKKLVDSVNGEFFNDQELIDTVVNLIEYPFPIIGKIEKEFLELPPEVIITPMRVHQKYFPIYKDNHLLPYFITVSNTKAKNMEVVKKGNERVLKARLNDAKFFFQEDRKYPLEHFVEKLRKVVFQKELGTSYEKMERFKELACYLAEILSPEEKDITERAAYLCKGDLETNMVYEFPELQGIMGKYYAIYSGEKKQVANAIYEHYLPRYAGDKIPTSNPGAFISIADRIDSIVGFFAIGKIPTGAADPYALRRHSIAIINIIIEKKYRLSLKELLIRSKELYFNKLKITDDVLDKIIEFISQRFKNLMIENFSYDLIDSVLAKNFDDIYLCYKKLKDLAEIKKDKNFNDIIIPFKRVANITKNWDYTKVDESLLIEKEEKMLFQKFLEVKNTFEKNYKQEKFYEALKSFTLLKDAINNFFDNILVMDKNEQIKNNRLNLLKNIYNTFNQIADITQIVE